MQCETLSQHLADEESTNIVHRSINHLSTLTADNYSTQDLSEK